MKFAWPALAAALMCGHVHAQAQSQAQMQTQAQAQPFGTSEWSIGVAPVHRTLTEHTPAGARLLTERGTLGRVDVAAQPRQWDRRLQLRGALTQGRLDYAGQTQSGIPLNTTTRHTEGELGAHWRTLAAPAWGDLSVGADWLRMRRAVAAAPGAGALTETSSLLMPAVQWRSPSLGIGGVALQADARLRSSVVHRLRVHFHGAFDDTSIHGGRRNEASVGVSALFARDWLLGLSWSHARQKPSAEMTLARAGTWVGTVRQPELRIDDVTLRLSRNF